MTSKSCSEKATKPLCRFLDIQKTKHIPQTAVQIFLCGYGTIKTMNTIQQQKQQQHNFILEYYKNSTAYVTL
jgi:hypothetical protein